MANWLDQVEQNGYALDFVPRQLRTKKLCMAAVRQNGNALYYVPKDLQNKETCLAAIRQNGDALYYVPEQLQTKEMCLTAAIQNAESTKWLSNEMCKCIKDDLEQMFAIVLDIVPLQLITESYILD